MNFIIKSLGLSLLTGTTIVSANALGAVPIVGATAISTADVYGAFDGSYNQDILITINYPKKGQVLEIKYFNNKTGALVISESQNLNITSTKILITLTYNLKIKNRLTSSGLRIEFTIKKDNESVTSVSIILYPIITQTINGFDYINKPYVISERTFQLLKSTVIAKDEQYQFKGTNKELYLNKDYTISLEELYFSYCDNGEGESELLGLNDNNYLCIFDRYDYFKYIDKDKDGYINIPVLLYQKDGYVYFAYKQSMYVDPNTLNMSLEKRSGFIETNAFYLAPEILKIIDDDAAYFRLENMGRNKTTIELPMLLKHNNNFIGMCYDSDYCFEGGIRA